MTINVSTLFDVALSLVFIFFTFSLFVSGIVELFNALIDQRSQLLKLALIKILESPDPPMDHRKTLKQVDEGDANAAPMFARFWNHPLVKIKEQRFFGSDKPISYLSADSFSTVIIDLLNRSSSKDAADVAVAAPDDKEGAALLASIRVTVANQGLGQEQSVGADPNLDTLARLVKPFLDRSTTLAQFKAGLERWYDGYMEQVSGWYKRYVQVIVRVVALLIAIALNVDTIYITKQLFIDPALRNNLVKAAERAVDQQASEAYGGQKKPTVNKPVNSTATSTSSVTSIGDSSLVTTTTSTTTQTGTAVTVQTMPLPVDSGFKDYVCSIDSSICRRLDSLQKGTLKQALTTTDSLQLRATYIRYAKNAIDELNLPVGWTLKASNSEGIKKYKEQYNQICTQISWLGLLGWLLTAAALSFGAPFWFDLLIKLVNIRNVGKKPASSAVPDK